MKKIIVILILSLLLVSCNEKTEQKQEMSNSGISIVNQDITKNEDINIKNQDITKNELQDDDKTEKKVEKILEQKRKEQYAREQATLEKVKKEEEKRKKERYKKLNKVLENYKTLPLNYRADLNCYELTRNDEKDILNQCIEIRKNAIEQLQKERKTFKLSDCKIEINKRYLEQAKFEKENKQQFPDDFKGPTKEEKEQFKQQEIKMCEFTYIFDYSKGKGNCNLLKDDKKTQECKELQKFQEMTYKLKNIQETSIDEYIR